MNTYCVMIFEKLTKELLDVEWNGRKYEKGSLKKKNIEYYSEELKKIRKVLL